MPTSRGQEGREGPTPARHALDALVLSVILAFLPELARPLTGAYFDPHPGWIAVVLLAARSGGSGLFMGLLAAAAAMGIGSAVVGGDPVESWSGLDSLSNLAAFGACLMVSWVASWHLRRYDDLSERLEARTARAAEAEAAVTALRDVVSTLRGRVDRTSTSLSFLRDVAGRLEGTDPVAAAEGAADLALARAGASAAMVNVGRNGYQRPLAVRDARGPRALAPLTVRDANVVVPIRDGTEQVGAIALWDVPHAGLDATSHDLELIASWCGRALGASPPNAPRAAPPTEVKP